VNKEIDVAIKAIAIEARAHGATPAEIEQLTRQLKRLADIEHETTNKVPD
jgi:hypothetical protein